MESSLLVALIILLPLAGAILTGLVPLFAPSLRSESLIGTLGTLAVAIPFAIVLFLFLTFGGEPVVVSLYTWMAAGDFSVDIAYRVDQLSLLMGLIVTGVGALIHVYSVGYMHGDRGFWKFFAFLNLFIFAMLNLIMADNLVLLFLGWEGVGLCSYLLIGFWYEELSNSAAANKAFIVNRIGDAAFILAMLLIFRELGSLDFGAILSFAQDLTLAEAPGWVTWAVLLLFIGATGKSAQIPLFVWLPDAMAGPTPVSALIHAATMVTSGLYLLARLSDLVLLTPALMATIAIVGALTALMAATIAITQNDIKKVLAYSTVSQLGFMFMAAGVGAFFVAIFHVMTHAFFKGCLFLGAGSVIHGMHEVEHELEHEGVIPAGHGVDEAAPHEVEAQKDVRQNPLPYEGPFDAQDMRTMGGLQEYMPSTGWTYLLSTLAIAGVPLFSGFFSKDEILYMAFSFGFDGVAWGWAVYGIGIFTALLTAIYMTRSYILTFMGKPRWPLADRITPHESPSSMTIPLWTLAGLAAVGGFLGLPDVMANLVGWENWIHHYLGAPYGGPVAEAELATAVPAGITWALIGVGAAVALLGVYFAWTRYSRYGLAYDETLQQRFGGLYRLWSGKYYWDEAYDRVVVRPVIEGAEKVLQPIDALVVDGAVNGLARLMYRAGGLFSRIQTGVVQNYAMALVLGAVVVVALILLM